MSWEEVEITLPNTVNEVYQELLEMDPEAFIAGGFVFDQYTGHSFKDVDIFLHDSNRWNVLRELRKKGYDPISISGEYDMLMIGENGAYEFSHKGVLFQLIFTGYGLDILDYFDIRIRECYYQNGKAYFSEEAMEDMKKKEIHSGIIHDSFRTIHRAFRFEEKYGYIIPEHSLQRMVDSCDPNSYGLDRFVSSEVHKESIKKRFYALERDFVENRRFKQRFRKPFDYLKNVKYHVKRDLFDKIYTHKESLTKTVSYSFPYDPFLAKITETEEEIKKYIQTNGLRLLFEFPEKAKEWKENIDNPTYLYTIFQTDIHSYKYNRHELIEPVRTLFQTIENLQKSSFSCPKDFNIIFSSKNSLHEKINIEDYLNNQYVYITLKEKDREFYQNIFSFKENKMTNNHIRELIKEFYEPIVIEELNKLLKVKAS